MGSHHLESEGAAAEKPKATKVIVIAPEDHVMLVEGKRRLDAQICNEDGTGCKGAGNKAKWSVKPRNGLRLSAKKGAASVAEGQKAGLYTVTVKQGQTTGSTTVKVNEPPPEREPTGPAADEYRVYISPEEATLAEGQHAAFMLWGCLLGEDGRLGLNGLPDGVDDECIELIIDDLIYDAEAVTVLGPQGSRFVVTMEAFPESSSEDRAFVGVQAVTEFGTALASIVKTRAQELDEFIEGDQQLGDTNDNGIWDSEDWTELWTAMYAGRYDPIFDVDENGQLDAVDWDALTAGEPGMPTPPPSRTDEGSASGQAE